jgi:hypothetical protein
MAADPASVKDLYHALCGGRYCLERQAKRQQLYLMVPTAQWARLMPSADRRIDVDVDDCAKVGFADAA